MDGIQTTVLTQKQQAKCMFAKVTGQGESWELKEIIREEWTK